MNDHEDIQKLIALKRYELPPEGFVDDLLIRLHERQRADLLQQSALSLVWERIVTYIQHFSAPQWTLASVAALLMLGALVGLSLGDTSTRPFTEIPPTNVTEVKYVPSDGRENSPVIISAAKAGTLEAIRESDLLLGNHFKGGLASGSSLLKLEHPLHDPHPPMMVSPIIRLESADDK